MRLYLVRHADVTIRPDLSGALWHLSAEGRRQAEELGTQPYWPGVRGLHTSPEPKAAGTAQRIAAPNGLPIRVEPDLREVEGRPFVEREVYLDQARRYLGGEDIEDWEPRDRALSRVRGCIASIIERHQGLEVGIVSHGLALTLYLSDLLGLDGAAAYEVWSSIRMPDVAIVDPEARKPERAFGGSA
ncbi:MAG: histidine phosphatase family protein [Dehalococcoidia bacterium]